MEDEDEEVVRGVVVDVGGVSESESSESKASESGSESSPLSSFGLFFSPSRFLFSALPPAIATPKGHCFTVLSPQEKKDLPSAAMEIPFTQPLWAVLLFHTVRRLQTTSQ